MGQVRDIERIAAGTTVLVMMVTMPMLFHYCEAAAGTVTWGFDPKTSWKKGKTFQVGDQIVFNYSAAAHNLAANVSKADYKHCKTHAPLSKNKTVTLENVGPNYFICTKPDHCKLGEKLIINATEKTKA